jgi:hypothetical protein
MQSTACENIFVQKLFFNLLSSIKIEFKFAAILKYRKGYSFYT